MSTTSLFEKTIAMSEEVKKRVDALWRELGL